MSRHTPGKQTSKCELQIMNFIVFKTIKKDLHTDYFERLRFEIAKISISQFEVQSSSTQ